MSLHSEWVRLEALVTLRSPQRRIKFIVLLCIVYSV